MGVVLGCHVGKVLIDDVLVGDLCFCSKLLAGAIVDGVVHKLGDVRLAGVVVLGDGIGGSG